jgi:hypothetical protein
MLVDTSGWSGDGDFTIELLEILKGVEEIAALRVEDAPASRTGVGYNFLVNEIFVSFATTSRKASARWLGIVPVNRLVQEKRLGLSGLEARLREVGPVGPADYCDEGMLQYLRTQRVIAHYQTRGYKMVEMVRIYETKTP